MTASITQRPASFAPVNNPVVYKFSTTGGPFTNYRIEIEVFAGGVSVGSIFSFTPNSSNVTTADISAILKSILYREWSTTASEDGIGSTEFYIKYQEIYTGSATSQTSDSANTKVGVLAGLQIGSSADLDDYVIEDSTKLFLTKFDILKYWTGYPFSVSFLNGFDDVAYTLKSYGNNDTLLGTATGNITSPDVGLNRYLLSESDIFSGATKLKLFLNGIDQVPFPPDYTTWSDSGSGFTKATNTLSKSPMTFFTYGAIKTIQAIPAGTTPNTITLFITATGTPATTVSVTVRYVKSGGAVVATKTNIAPAGTSNIYSFNFSALTDVANSIEIIATTAVNTNGVTIGITTENIFTLTTTQVSEEKEISIQSACKNPVYLFWKNSLGGDSFYMFFFGQEDYFTYDNGRKAKRQVLYAENLSYNEWEAINELNTPGQRYQVAIPELTTSVDKTGKRTDQQVYVVDTDGNKTGVIVIPRSTSARTDKKIHSISVEIEYPTIFL